MEESRLVAAQQVEETRKNVKFIGVQTDILEQGRIVAERQYYNQQFQEVLNLFCNQCEEVSRQFHIYPIGRPQMIKSGGDIVLVSLDSNNHPETRRRAREFCLQIIERFGAFPVGKLADGVMHYEYDGLNTLIQLLDRLTTIIQLREKTSASEQEYIDYLEVETVEHEVNKVVLILSSHGLKAT